MLIRSTSILILLAAAHPAFGRSPVTPAAVDSVAKGFALAIASATAGAFSATTTLHTAEFESAVYSPALGQAQKALKEYLTKHLLEGRLFVLIEGPDAGQKADLTLLSSIIELEDSLLATVRLIDRRRQVLLVSDQRLILGETPGVPPTEVAKAPADASGRPQWFVLGGTFLKNKDRGWDVGVAFRPLSRRWQVEAEIGRFSHTDLDFNLYGAYPNDLHRNSHLAVSFARARGEFLYRIEVIRGPHGEPLFRFPGYIKVGGGLGAYRIRDRYSEEYRFSGTVSNTRTHLIAVPMFHLAIAREIGSRLEVQVGAEYAFAPQSYGINDFGVGGAYLNLRLSYRLW